MVGSANRRPPKAVAFFASVCKFADVPLSQREVLGTGQEIDLPGLVPERAKIQQQAGA